MGTETNPEDRLFVKGGWRHYRRTYSVTEVRWGLVTGGVLVLIAAYVAWRAEHPLDPNLFSDGATLLKAAGPRGELTVALGSAAPPVAGPAMKATANAGAETAGPAATTQVAATPGADRGPLPKQLAGAGWREDKITQFDPENLYVKIDGRADFFRTFGFKRLWNVLLVSEKDPATTVDVEMYDMGSGANALGAYGGERAPTAKPTVTEAGLHHLDRNALYLARAPFYIRVIGSDETSLITGKLGELADTLVAAVKGEPLPWAYGVFIGQMGIDPGKIAYFPDNAFSQAFAHDVWTIRPGAKDDDLELFLVAKDSAAAAKKMAGAFGKGFGEMGEAAGKLAGGAGLAGMALIKDQFLGTLSAATTVDRFVIGVRGAKDPGVVEQELGKLKDAVAQMPGELKARAKPAKASQGGSGEH